jgi:FKBP-type peptidyl-prolyl cis-trans isomerase (trigger factor)
MQTPVTRQEIEQKMDELAREFAETHDPEIIEEIYRLSRELEKGCD